MLEDIVGKRKDWKDDAWSDLEALLGKATTGFKVDDEEFDLIFEEMQQAFVGFADTEQKKLPNALPEELVEEFWSSICDFPKRLAAADQALLPANDSLLTNIHYKFISLNYTTVFDKFLESAKRSHEPFRRRPIGNAVYVDNAGDPLHLRGIIEEDEHPEIVFGVARPENLANHDFANSSQETELWVKSNKNHSIYGNKKNGSAKAIVDGTDVFCIFGCSLGESDAYIWEMIGNRLTANPSVYVVLFDYSLPDRFGQESRRYQKRRDELRDDFLRKVNLVTGDERDDATRESFASRIITVPSKTVFNVSLLSDAR